MHRGLHVIPFGRIGCNCFNCSEISTRLALICRKGRTAGKQDQQHRADRRQQQGDDAGQDPIGGPIADHRPVVPVICSCARPA